MTFQYESPSRILNSGKLYQVSISRIQKSTVFEVKIDIKIRFLDYKEQGNSVPSTCTLNECITIFYRIKKQKSICMHRTDFFTYS